VHLKIIDHTNDKCYKYEVSCTVWLHWQSACFLAVQAIFAAWQFTRSYILSSHVEEQKSRHSSFGQKENIFQFNIFTNNRTRNMNMCVKYALHSIMVDAIHTIQKRKLIPHLFLTCPFLGVVPTVQHLHNEILMKQKFWLVSHILKTNKRFFSKKKTLSN